MPGIQPLLGIDAGGTRTRALVVDADGRRVESEAGPANWTTLGAQRCRMALEAAIRGAMESAGLRASDLGAACVALAGYYPPWHESEAGAALADLLPGVPLRLVPDLLAAWAGAFSGRPGGVIVAGTGAVAYGRDATGAQARAGGWGPLFGDEGSGFWIGCQALRSAARALDGRGGDTLLLPALQARQQQEQERALSPEEVLRAVYRDDWPRERVASLAPIVARLAAEGDREAAAILEQAGGALAELALAVVCRLDWRSGPPRLVAIGGVTEAGPSLWKPLRQGLAAVRPDACWASPEGSPVEGAVLMARELLRWQSR
jgi:N-acetylglucosamine kinase-like BadF-type ATPase